MPVLSKKSMRKMSKVSNPIDINHHIANNNDNDHTDQHTSHHFLSNFFEIIVQKIKPSSNSQINNTYINQPNTISAKRQNKDNKRNNNMDTFETIVDENSSSSSYNTKKSNSRINRIIHSLSFQSCGSNTSNNTNHFSHNHYNLNNSLSIYNQIQTNNNSNSKNKNTFPLHLLPEELLIKVAMNFTVDMVYRVSLVCTDLNRLMQDIGLWRYKVEEKWIPMANPMSQLAINHSINGVGGNSYDNLIWKQYYHMREVLVRKGAVSSMSIRPKGSVPSPRYQHTGTVVGSSIYYVGGQETQLRRFNDIFRFNTETHRFARLEVSGTVPKFARHTAVALGHKIYVFGGFDGSGIYFDLAVFDTETLTWTNPTVSGSPPRSRTNHASAIVGNKLYVFGGINRDARWELQDLDEFFVFDIATMTWSEVNAGGDKPTARCGHRLVAIGQKLYMFGGGAGDSWRERFNDMHIYDTETNLWRRIPSTPFVRVCTFSSVFVIGNLVGVFGGQHLIKGKVTKKMYFFDTISESWSKQDFNHSGPNPRDMASADVVGDRIYMFGGYDGRAMDDLNIITLSNELKSLLPTIKSK